MRCVWVDAIAGSDRMPDDGAGIRAVQVPLNWRLQGRLERVLRAGKFAVTSELDPLDSADPA